MIHLSYSNRTEALFEQFARDLGARRRAVGGLFEPAPLVVPNQNVETWLKRALARRDGIAANFEVLLLRRFVAGLVRHKDPDLRLVDSDLLQDLLLSLLMDGERLAGADLSPVRAWLAGGGEAAEAIDLRRVQLATQLARLFEEYGFSRPEMLEAWPRGETLPSGRWRQTEAWQRRLWLQIFGEGGLLVARGQKSGERFLTLSRVLADLPADALGDGRPVHLFGVSYVASLFQRALARIAGQGELFVYTLNPCMEFWEDLRSGREVARRERLPKRGVPIEKGALEGGEDPFGLRQAGDTPALVLWGRPGRENIRLLDQLSECDFRDAFEDPLADGAPTLLRQLQRDILWREPERARPDPAFGFEADRSVRFMACPSVRREAEAIASEVWSLLREAEAAGQEIRFTDIAVMVAGHESEAYFTHLASAFGERGFDLPYTIEAAALLSQSPIAEAAQLLLELPLSRFSRAEVLRVIGHPSVAARFPAADPGEWARWCDALGIFHGVDRQDQDGSYLDRDLHNWDQGLRRLALGAVMTGAKSREPRAFELAGERYLPEEHLESSEGGAARFGRLVRSLLADARFARSQRLPLPDWADLLSGLLSTYLVARNDWEKRDLDHCVTALRSLARLSLDGKAVGYRVALELARAALSDLRTSRGPRRCDQGVSISTLQPMRALPFKAIFVAGLSEGRFPAPDRQSELDLRGARARAGDVSPREQDQYMFLETLLCARERLVLSYVARNELTGEELQPSPVVVELWRMLERGYLEDAKKKLVRQVKLRRFDEEEGPVPPEAKSEKQMLALRGSLGAQGLDLDRLEEELPRETFRRLEARLRSCRVPKGRRALAAEGPLRIRLSDLRRFLECPLQGTARFLLKLQEDEDEPALVEDEPFDGGRLELVQGQRHVFEEWLRWGRSRPFEEIAREWAEPLVAAGRLPAGILWEMEKASLLAGPNVWRERLELQGTPVLSVQVHRFGPASERSRVDRAHDPIPLSVEGVEGVEGALPVEIVGTTGPIFEDGASELGLFQRRRLRKDLEEARCRQDSLGAFLDHLAFSAAGLRRDGFASAQYYDREGAGGDERYLFAPVGVERAREHLAALARELLVVRELLLPAMAVFAFKGGGERQPFAEIIGELIDNRCLASQYGPVRNAQDFHRPTDDEARSLLAPRLGLYFEMCEKVQDARGGQP